MTVKSSLTSISPLDGRYSEQTSPLSPYLSEYALIKTRVEVEARYLIALSEIGIIRKLTAQEVKTLQEIGPNLSISDAEYIKDVEQTTKHDVKAVELVFREKVEKGSLDDIVEMIHFGLTSEDINNLSYRLMMKRAGQDILIPQIKKLLEKLLEISEEYQSTPMLARTHGQAAVPTTLGHEMVVFADRLGKELNIVKQHELRGKLSGAVGSFNAVYVAYPDIDWVDFSGKFISSLNLQPNLATTQINTYEDVTYYLQCIQRTNGILLDFSQDMWRYISDGWFGQVVKKEEVGSSTMPQKVNPIMFENAEGNLGMANSMIEFFVRKLPVSRLQRDLSDSTTMRNIGSIFGYSLLAYSSILVGMLRVKVNTEKLNKELDSDWSVLSEAAQTIMRRVGVTDPYSILKNLTRGKQIDQALWEEIVKELPVDIGVKTELNNLTPRKYTGLADEITRLTIKRIRNTL